MSELIFVKTIIPKDNTTGKEKFYFQFKLIDNKGEIAKGYTVNFKQFKFIQPIGGFDEDGRPWLSLNGMGRINITRSPNTNCEFISEKIEITHEYRKYISSYTIKINHNYDHNFIKGVLRHNKGHKVQDPRREA